MARLSPPVASEFLIKHLFLTFIDFIVYLHNKFVGSFDYLKYLIRTPIRDNVHARAVLFSIMLSRQEAN